MKALLLVGTYFPYGTAWSSRGRNFVELLKYCGYEVHVISYYSKPEDKKRYQSCTYDYLKESSKGIDQLYIGKLCALKLKKYLKNHQVDIVVSTSCPDRFKLTKKILDEKNIPLFLEQCEWYDPSNFKFKKYDYLYQRYIKHFDNYFYKSSGIIAISTLLEKHFIKQNLNTIRIPTILDVKNIKYNTISSNEKCVLVYTGNPGRSKELLLPIIKVFANHLDIRNFFEFRIYGPTYEKVLLNIDNRSDLLEKTKDTVKIFGKVPQENIEKIIRDADFQMFFRPKRLSSEAGFPTKLGESMAVGTPVISNGTGDIGMYLKNEKNGYLTNDFSEETIEKVLRKIMKLDEFTYCNMRVEARNTAELFFDYRKYMEKILKLVSK